MMTFDISGINKYRAGYADCVREVQRYLETPDAQTMCVIDPGIRQRLLRHLENCVAEIDTDISPQALPTPCAAVQQAHHPELNTLFKEVIDNKIMSISNPSAMDYPTKMETISQISESSLPTDLMFPGSNASNLPDEKKVRLEPDSSTAEEINNNNNGNNTISSRMEPEIGVAPQQHVGTLPNNVIRMYDGNFVFVLPSHYIQLAAALGINLNNQVGGVPVPVAETSSPPEAARTQVEPHTPIEVQPERPLDFSKNNECNDSMWRPW